MNVFVRGFTILLSVLHPRIRAPFEAVARRRRVSQTPREAVHNEIGCDLYGALLTEQDREVVLEFLAAQTAHEAASKKVDLAIAARTIVHCYDHILVDRSQTFYALRLLLLKSRLTAEDDVADLLKQLRDLSAMRVPHWFSLQQREATLLKGMIDAIIRLGVSHEDSKNFVH